MSEFKGTKEKWRLKKDNPDYSRIVVLKKEGIKDIAQIDGYMNDLSRDENNFNAKLISKAPEMLQALQNVIDHKERILKIDDDVLEQMIYSLKKLIKQATEL